MPSSASDPVIGLTTYVDRARFGIWEDDAALLHQRYVEVTARAGGSPVLLPPGGDARELVRRVDGLVLVGGADVDPGRYGASPHPTTVTRPDRDAAEFALAAAALDAGLPVLGVCRGMQVLNVALGGTLHQHLPDRLGTHAHQPAPGVFGRSEVRTAPGSRIAGIVGESVEVRCHHHQAIADLGRGLVPVAWAADGTVEAVETGPSAFVLGVQWHPEQVLDDVRLFAALVAAARSHQEERACST